MHFSCPSHHLKLNLGRAFHSSQLQDGHILLVEMNRYLEKSITSVKLWPDMHTGGLCPFIPLPLLQLYIYSSNVGCLYGNSLSETEGVGNKNEQETARENDGKIWQSLDKVSVPESPGNSHPRRRATPEGQPTGGCLDSIHTACGIYCVCVCVCVCVVVCVRAWTCIGVFAGFSSLWLHCTETSNRRVKCFKWTPRQQYASFPDNMIQPCSSH